MHASGSISNLTTDSISYYLLIPIASVPFHFAIAIAFRYIGMLIHWICGHEGCYIISFFVQLV
jgi:hypothetical protein